MNVTFDVNFWTLAMFSLNFLLAVGGIISARNHASANALEQSRREQASALEQLRREQSAALEAHKEKVGVTFTRMGERLQSCETDLKNSITHEDLSAVHKRVDEVHKMVSQIGSSVSRVEGILEGWNKKQ